MSTKKPAIYIAGPMSGIENHNADNFNEAAEEARSEGFEVFNPIDSPASRLVQEGKMSGQEAYRQCLALDLKWICETATHIFMLEGWENSPGARSEHATATALGLTIFYET